MGGWRDFHEVSITPADGCMIFFGGGDCVVITLHIPNSHVQIISPSFWVVCTTNHMLDFIFVNASSNVAFSGFATVEKKQLQSRHYYF